MRTTWPVHCCNERQFAKFPYRPFCGHLCPGFPYWRERPKLQTIWWWPNNSQQKNWIWVHCCNERQFTDFLIPAPIVGHALVNSVHVSKVEKCKSDKSKVLMWTWQCFSSQVSRRNLPNLLDNLSVGRQADVVTLFSPQDFSICHSGFLNAVTLVLWLWIQIKVVNWRCWFQRTGIAGC